MILASASPRRKELLSYIISDFDVIPSGIDEVATGTPAQQVETLATDKAVDITRIHPDALVIGADTLVALGGRLLGKPTDADDAFRMLKMLSGRVHHVYTGIAVVLDGHMHTAVECTRVQFTRMSDSEIREYIATGEPLDKAGAYGIQGYGGKFIRGVVGDYYNVMGLPLNRLYAILTKL